MAKRTMVSRTMRGARNVMKNYVRPGAKTAEETIADLMHVMGEARDMLARVKLPSRSGGRKKSGRKSGGRKRRKTNVASVRRSVKRSAKRTKAGRKTGSKAGRKGVKRSKRGRR